MKECLGLNRYVLAGLLVVGLALTGFAGGDKDLQKRKGKKVKNNRQGMTQNVLNAMPKEDRDKLRRMQKENPDTFRKKIQSMAKKYKAKHLKANQRKEMDELSAKYHDAEGEEKVKLLATIKGKITKQFNDKMLHNRENIAKTEKRLNELKAQLQKREDNAEKIIQERVRFLTKDPNLRW